jgi:hypothetical protein
MTIKKQILRIVNLKEHKDFACRLRGTILMFSLEQSSVLIHVYSKSQILSEKLLVEADQIGFDSSQIIPGYVAGQDYFYFQAIFKAKLTRRVSALCCFLESAGANVRTRFNQISTQHMTRKLIRL